MKDGASQFRFTMEEDEGDVTEGRETGVVAEGPIEEPKEVWGRIEKAFQVVLSAGSISHPFTQIKETVLPSCFEDIEGLLSLQEGDFVRLARSGFSSFLNELLSKTLHQTNSQDRVSEARWLEILDTCIGFAQDSGDEELQRIGGDFFDKMAQMFSRKKS